MKYRLVRIFVFLIIGMGIGYGVLFLQKQKELDGEITEISEAASILKAPVQTQNEDQDLKSDIGGPFTLINQNGETVTQENYKNSYKLVFFGFTFCPAICPTELQKIMKVMQDLGPTAEKIQPLLITVDPARDTPARLKEYLANFHPKQVGLTGSQEQIEAVKQSYRIYASKVEMGSPENYMFDHSSFTYLMGPDDKLIAIYPSSDTAEKIVADISGRGL